jgi:hypothetical protein
MINLVHASSSTLDSMGKYSFITCVSHVSRLTKIRLILTCLSSKIRLSLIHKLIFYPKLDQTLVIPLLYGLTRT